MQFEFATATRIIFGPGALQQVGPLAAEMGQQAFVVTGSTNERAAPLLEQLRQRGLETVTFNVSGEPTTTLALEGVQQARTARCDLVIGLGGGLLGLAVTPWARRISQPPEAVGDV